MRPPLTPSAFRSLGRAAAGAFGFDLIKRHYYSAIPDLRTLPEHIWAVESPMRGLRLDAADGLAFVEAELGSHLGEYRPPRTRTTDARDYYLENTLYESVDAETLYAMVRRFAPPRIIELGSGFSTLVMGDAVARNEQLTAHTVYDPYPRSDLKPAIEKIATLQPVGATDIPLREFEQLRAGDLLFVDTTHTVKIGSDVNRVILEVLPILAPGVLVHFHDIFLPWEYPREFLEKRHFFWAEQYLLQAFLSMNAGYEVLFSAHAIHRRYPDEVARIVPSSRAPGTRPAAFWIRRSGD